MLLLFFFKLFLNLDLCHKWLIFFLECSHWSWTSSNSCRYRLLEGNGWWCKPILSWVSYFKIASYFFRRVRLQYLNPPSFPWWKTLALLGLLLCIFLFYNCILEKLTHFDPYNMMNFLMWWQMDPSAGIEAEYHHKNNKVVALLRWVLLSDYIF